MGKMSRLEKWFVNRANRYIYKHVVKGQLQKHLTLAEGPVILELGCGTGQAAVLINEVYKPKMFRVTDYDVSQVRRAEETFLETYGQLPNNVVLETADALNLQYGDEIFDVVFAFLVLHHLGKFWGLKEHMLRGLDEIDRSLKIRGHLVYLEIWYKRTIREHLKVRGYDLVYQKNYFGLAELVIAQKGQ